MYGCDKATKLFHRLNLPNAKNKPIAFLPDHQCCMNLVSSGNEEFTKPFAWFDDANASCTHTCFFKPELFNMLVHGVVRNMHGHPLKHCDLEVIRTLFHLLFMHFKDVVLKS